MLFKERRDKLFDMVSFAKENVPFYRRLYSQIELIRETFTYDFFKNNIPIINKKDIFMSENSYVADKYIENPDKLMIEYTSGSSGTPFTCYKDRRTRIALASSLSELRKKYTSDYTVGSKYATFYGIIEIDGVRRANEIFIHKNILYIPVLDMNDEQLKKNWQAIIEYNPLWLTGTATAVMYLARCVRKLSLPMHNFGFIELNGEIVSESAYNYIKETFGCQITNHYGLREFWCIAYSCPNNHLHILDKNVFVEDVYNDSIGEKTLVCTSLKNFVAPLIRYELGDAGEVHHCVQCGFNNSNYTLEVNKGRVSCYFELCGRLINLFTFALVIKNTVDAKKRNKILQYQVIKTSEKNITIRLVMNAGETLEDSDTRRIVSEINQYAKINAEILIETVAYIKPSDNGKVPEFIDMTKIGG